MLDERDWLRELITVRSQVGVEVNQTGTVAGTLQDSWLVAENRDAWKVVGYWGRDEAETLWGHS